MRVIEGVRGRIVVRTILRQARENRAGCGLFVCRATFSVALLTLAIGEDVMLKSTESIVAGALLLAVLAACGSGGETSDPAAGAEMLANGMTVGAQIEARQGGFKTFGKNFKTISDQLKSDSADMAAVQAAAATIADTATGLGDWFPEGTGPESGVETEALAIIWEDGADFATKVSDAQAAIEGLNLAAQSGDAEAISTAFRNAGGTCKACHDKFRLDD